MRLSLVLLYYVEPKGHVNSINVMISSNAFLIISQEYWNLHERVITSILWPTWNLYLLGYLVSNIVIFIFHQESDSAPHDTINQAGGEGTSTSNSKKNSLGLLYKLDDAPVWYSCIFLGIQVQRTMHVHRWDSGIYFQRGRVLSLCLAVVGINFPENPVGGINFWNKCLVRSLLTTPPVKMTRHIYTAIRKKVNIQAYPDHMPPVILHRIHNISTDVGIWHRPAFGTLFGVGFARPIVSGFSPIQPFTQGHKAHA